ncbi:hypothetical protein ScPMuIL_002924 [Solemya velum]
MDVNKQQTLVAVASNDEVHFYKHPYNEKSVLTFAKKFQAKITNMKFTADGKFLLTVGGRESTLLQWKLSDCVKNRK